MLLFYKFPLTFSLDVRVSFHSIPFHIFIILPIEFLLDKSSEQIPHDPGCLIVIK